MPSHVLSVAAQSPNARAVRTAGNELSRRQLLTATGAAALAGASTATAETAAPHPDAELLALGEELAAGWEVERTASAEAKRDAAYETCSAIVSSIALVPARTLDGLKVKAMAFLWCGHEVGETIEDLCLPGHTSDAKIALSIACDLARDVSDDVRRLAVWRAA